MLAPDTFKSLVESAHWRQSIFALSTRARYFWVEEIISPLKVSGLPQVEGYLKMSLGKNVFAGLQIQS